MLINMLKTDPEYSKIYSSVVEDQTELLNKGIRLIDTREGTTYEII